MTIRQASTRNIALAALTLLSLAGCVKRGDIDQTGGIVQIRTACPPVGIPAQTGDITIFNPPQSTESRAIDVVATITNVRSVCNDQQPQIYTEATFDVLGQRPDASVARQFTLPYFSTVVRGGTSVVAKRIGQVTLDFAAGAYRAQATVKAGSYIDREAATLPDDIRQKIVKKRKPGDLDAAVDPLADPEVKAALQRTSFELLIGFNLTQDQLRYNATR